MSAEDELTAAVMEAREAFEDGQDCAEEMSRAFSVLRLVREFLDELEEAQKEKRK